MYFAFDQLRIIGFLIFFSVNLNEPVLVRRTRQGCIYTVNGQRLQVRNQEEPTLRELPRTIRRPRDPNAPPRAVARQNNGRNRKRNRNHGYDANRVCVEALNADNGDQANAGPANAGMVVDCPMVDLTSQVPGARPLTNIETSM